jgi:hypothetical protein
MDTPTLFDAYKPAIPSIEDFAFRVEMMSEPIENEFSKMKENEHAQSGAGGGNHNDFEKRPILSNIRLQHHAKWHEQKFYDGQ